MNSVQSVIERLEFTGVGQCVIVDQTLKPNHK